MFEKLKMNKNTLIKKKQKKKKQYKFAQYRIKKILGCRYFLLNPASFLFFFVGERPFQCNQCGVSFTQKGNLLRHIKLHTGEKPFKCPFCSYACRRRDALTGHLRTHAVGKPHKCNYCGRSYKQRTSLEEHKERCHSYLQGIGLGPNADAGPYTENRLSKLQQYDKQAELMPPHMMEQAITNAMTYLGSEPLRPLIHHPGPPMSMADVVPLVNPLFHRVLPIGQRTERPGNCETLQPLPPQPPDFPSHPISNGPTALRQGKQPQPGQEESPNHSGVESADSARSSPQERPGFHGRDPPSGLRSRASPATVCSGDRVVEPSPRSGAGMGPALMRVPAERPSSHEGVRVFAREGHEVRAFQCEHCRVLFLDHVMYTIHMGCHGYRDPLECNICGHRSKDRYEFSSHIVRGEHTFQ
uniref:IKAROS family zinc finger 2 n=1 Tax=Sphaeramia orbicularis TaxID=375764 RepID=A0A673B7L6_9TELE